MDKEVHLRAGDRPAVNNRLTCTEEVKKVKCTETHPTDPARALGKAVRGENVVQLCTAFLTPKGGIQFESPQLA